MVLRQETIDIGSRDLEMSPGIQRREKKRRRIDSDGAPAQHGRSDETEDSDPNAHAAFPKKKKRRKGRGSRVQDVNITGTGHVNLLKEMADTTAGKQGDWETNSDPVKPSSKKKKEQKKNNSYRIPFAEISQEATDTGLKDLETSARRKKKKGIDNSNGRSAQKDTAAQKDGSGHAAKKKKKKNGTVNGDQDEIAERSGDADDLKEKDDQSGRLRDAASKSPEVSIPSSQKEKKKKSKRAGGHSEDQDAIPRQAKEAANAAEDTFVDAGGNKDPPSETPERVLCPLKKKKKKTVRFQLPDLDAPGELRENSSQGADSDDDATQFQGEPRGWKTDFTRQDLSYGRYSKEEDQAIIDSVHSYIKMRGWDLDEGLQIVLSCSKHAEARGCWLDIAKCLPYRAVKQINARAVRLLSGHKRGRWSPEELEILPKLVKLYGKDWDTMSRSSERSGQTLKDRWRKLKFGKKGVWTQDEFDKLCKLVRRDFVIKEKIGGKASGRREVRDNIGWEVISNEMQRNEASCLATWYSRLASPMVLLNRWANEDDRLLLESLLQMGSSSEEAVDWDNVLRHRDGAVCMERWTEMTRLLDRNTHVSFEEKVEILAKRYCPDLLGVIEEVPM